MNIELTDIVIVLDRSGSMEAIRSDAEGGLNALIEDQKSKPGYATFSLVQFDTEYEWIYRAKPIGDVGRFDLRPRGGTALLDAVGKAIAETGERYAATPEADRPGLVVFVIITDGQENSSTEYTRAMVRTMIERQEKDYKWQFIYLGANQNSFAEAGAIGISPVGTANYSGQHVNKVMRMASTKIAGMRWQSISGQNVTMDFSAKERAELVDPSSNTPGQS